MLLAYALLWQQYRGKRVRPSGQTSLAIAARNFGQRSSQMVGVDCEQESLWLIEQAEVSRFTASHEVDAFHAHDHFAVLVQDFNQRPHDSAIRFRTRSGSFKNRHPD